MSFADSNRTAIRLIEEITWGTTPTSGTTREVRLMSSSLSAAKETVVSDEIRADRMVSSIVEVSAMSNGDINFEFSAGAHDELLAAFVLGAWSRPMGVDFWKGTTVSIGSSTTATITGGDYTDYITNGRRMKLSGFANPTNNAYVSVASTAFSAGITTVTFNESTLVAEAGTNTARLADANDVIVLNNTSISVSAAGFDGNASDPFAAAISAGQLVVGQKVFVEGLGKETGTVVFDAGVATVTITVSDGVNSYAFVSGTDFTVGVSATADGAAFAAAVNAKRLDANTPVNVKAVNAAGTVTLSNLNVTGGSIVETVDDANVTVTNFSGGVANARGVFTVVSAADDLLVVSPPPGTFAAGLPVTVKGSMLRNPGVSTNIAQRKFTIETAFEDVSQYMVQDGMVPGTFSLEVAAGAIITGTFGFEGRSTLLRQTTLLGNTGTYTVLAAQTGEVVNATTDVGNLLKDGVDFGACIQSLSLSGEANLRQQACIGSKFSRGIGTGRFNLTGSMTVFFEDEDLFNDFINHETVSIEFSITDAEGVSYYWAIPAAKISQDQIAPGGIDQDVFENIEFTAFRDPATACMLQVDRFSSNAIN